MATLASIPEANTSLPSSHDVRPLHRRTASFERIRPRSRVVVLSRRPTRVRNLVRQPQAVPGRLRQAHGHRRPPAQGPDGPDTDSRRRDGSTRTATETHPQPVAPPNRLSDAASSADQTLESSVSSVDLDSFPLPPSSTVPWHQPGSTSRPDAQVPAATSWTREGVIPAHDRGVSAARRGFGDTAADVARTSKHMSVDSALVEAISRTIIQQLRLFSAIKQGDRGSSNPHKSPYAYERSSRREALDRFAKDLHRYAENTGAKGKTVHSTPTPTRSGETLHTVSALMPFRPEFRAAGLAVTSKDQAQRPPGHDTKAGASQPWRRRPPVAVQHDLHPSQLDGYQGRGPSTSTNTEISFAPSRNMDEWRYALIDEAPERKRRRPRKEKKSRNRCLPCLPGEDQYSTDAEWAHFRPAPGNAAPRPRDVAGPRQKMAPPCRPPPRPAKTRLPCRDSEAQSPGHRSGESGTRTQHKAKEPTAAPEPRAKSRTEARGRRDAITVPDPSPQADGSHGGFPQTNGRNTGHEDGGGPPAQQPGRSQSDRAQSARDAKKSERELGSARPWQSMSGGEISRAKAKAQPAKAQPASAADEHGARVTSALPSTWGRHDGPITSNLEEELEKTARLVAATKPPMTTTAATATSKRPSQPSRRQKRPASRYDPNHVGICCRSSRGVPARAVAPPNIPKRTSSIRGSVDSNEADVDDGEIADRDVLRGLHVAASAACDDEVDAFVRSRTGLRIRRFLADLMALEAVGGPRPGEDSEQRARRRRAEMRKLKHQVRRSREIAMAGGVI